MRSRRNEESSLSRKAEIQKVSTKSKKYKKLVKSYGLLDKTKIVSSSLSFIMLLCLLIIIIYDSIFNHIGKAYLGLLFMSSGCVNLVDATLNRINSVDYKLKLKKYVDLEFKMTFEEIALNHLFHDINMIDIICDYLS